MRASRYGTLSLGFLKVSRKGSSLAVHVAATETAGQQSGAVLMRDILQASMREKCQDARFAGDLQILCCSHDIDGIDGPAGETIDRAEDL